MHRVQVVGVTLVALLDQNGVLRGDLLALGDEFVEGSGGVLRQGVVAHQGDVLHRVGNTVEGAVAGEGLLGGIGETCGLVTELHGCDDAVLDEVADPVIGADDQIGSSPGGGLRDEIRANVIGGFLHHLQRDPGGLLEGLPDGLEPFDASLVGPHGESSGGLGTTRGTGGTVRRGVACGAAGGQGKDQAGGRQGEQALAHVVLLFCGSTSTPLMQDANKFSAFLQQLFINYRPQFDNVRQTD